jgi:predicted nucleotidyltransferase
MRTQPPALLPMFRSQMQVDLMALLVLQPERAWTLDQLARTLRAPASSVHRELNRAVDAGIIVRDDGQRPHLFRVSKDSPIYAPTRDLLDLTVGVPERLRRALAPFAGVRVAAIHGSWAKGSVRPASDIDVLVVADGDRRAIHRALRAVGREVGREIDASIITPQAFDELHREGNPFLDAILRGQRVDLVGDVAGLADAA